MQSADTQWNRVRVKISNSSARSWSPKMRMCVAFLVDQSGVFAQAPVAQSTKVRARQKARARRAAAYMYEGT